jgi:hypothetical protein
VRYTPHSAWLAPGKQAVSGKARAELMLRDAARYMPCFARAEHIGSLFELKAVLMQSEPTDARPILFEIDPRSDRVVSVLGSKFDNIYEVETLLRQRAWDA